MFKRFRRKPEQKQSPKLRELNEALKSCFEETFKAANKLVQNIEESKVSITSRKQSVFDDIELLAKYDKNDIYHDIVERLTQSKSPLRKELLDTIYKLTADIYLHFGTINGTSELMKKLQQLKFCIAEIPTDLFRM